MKKTIVFLVAMVPGLVSAWEVPGNPDRFPSFGVSFNNMELDGTRYETDLPNSIGRTQSGPVSFNTYLVGADFRIPINRSMTLSLNYDHVETDSYYNRMGSGIEIFNETKRMSGFKYGMGVRFYFNGGSHGNN